MTAADTATATVRDTFITRDTSANTATDTAKTVDAFTATATLTETGWKGEWGGWVLTCAGIDNKFTNIYT